MRRTFATVGALVACWALMGCASQVRTAPQLAQEEPFKIGREDVLDVSVWRDADLSRVIPVRPDGYISLPLAGEIQAEGHTPNELAEIIRQKLSPYVQEPKVTVMLHEVNSTRVFVTGEVAHPGAFPLRGKVSVLQAIALAGGFNAFANGDGIVVIRQGKNGGQIPVRYSDLTQVNDKDGSHDFFLMPGDTVVVP